MPATDDRPARHSCSGSSTTGRVAIVSASFGAGHDGAAAEFARQFRALGYTVDRHDFVDLVPARLGRLARAGYRRALLAAPSTWDWALHASEGSTASTRVATALHRIVGPSMGAAVGTADRVISTYPLASQVLGRMRRTGGLQAPVATFLTDMSVHPLWIADGIDTHWALHAEPAGQAAALGAADPCVVGAAVDPAYRPVHDFAERLAARAAFGLPASERLALVVAGSWGVGDVEQAAADIRATGQATPVVVCGNNERLRKRLAARGPGPVLGWVDRMPMLLRACDLVVQNAGGLTSLEALATGVPVLTYRALPGHGRTNAEALDRSGWAPWATDLDQLRALMRASLITAPRPLPRLTLAALAAVRASA